MSWGVDVNIRLRAQNSKKIKPQPPFKTGKKKKCII
jgi:hypothetical protein